MTPMYVTIQKNFNGKENLTLQHITIFISHYINMNISKELGHYPDVSEKHFSPQPSLSNV